MAITRAQQARQLYRTAGAVQAAYGDAAAKPGPVERPTVTSSSNDGGNNLQKVADVVGTAGDINRAKNVLTGGGLKAMIPEPTTVAAMLILNAIKNQNKNNQSLLTEDDEEVPMMANGGIMGGLADGQMDEMGRQMYGLGKLVKKVTRAVKKVVKSPIGKVAILGAGLYGLGGGTFFGKMLPGITRGGQGFGGFGGLSSIFGNVGDIVGGVSTGDKLAKLASLKNFPGGGIGLGITAASAVAGALTPEQENQAQQLADNTGFSIEEARNAILQAAKENYAMDVRARGFKADGGLMRLGYQEGSKEPVAKKTMPLLDMGGKEMDLREDGGFVPIGRMEKADDVPARLSKNEFVFTADAVRNAGDGDVDKGAEVMYNMMKNLESGGDVSEESQGLKGARRMFQTSQRLEEVL